MLSYINSLFTRPAASIERSGDLTTEELIISPEVPFTSINSRNLFYDTLEDYEAVLLTVKYFRFCNSLKLKSDLDKSKQIYVLHNLRDNFILMMVEVLYKCEDSWTLTPEHLSGVGESHPLFIKNHPDVDYTNVWSLTNHCREMANELIETKT